MKFTYDDYSKLIKIIKDQRYNVTGYNDYKQYEKTVILRHDIDFSIERALKFAELEHNLGISSTYFVLLTSDFYNLASYKNLAMINKISSLGHQIGLHFDEKNYFMDYNVRQYDETEIVNLIVKEKNIMEEIIGSSISVVSMHRPSKETLNSDLKINGMINTYGNEFFHNFKYLSDSRMSWKEDVVDLVMSNRYSRLQILTHAFWYENQDSSIDYMIKQFVNSGNIDRYSTLQDNITDLNSVMKISEVR